MEASSSQRLSHHHKKVIYQPKILNRKKPFPYILLSILIFLGFLIWDSLIPTLPEPSTFPTIYAHPSKEDLRLTFLAAIRKAKKSIFLCVFGMSDPSILNALKQQSEKGLDVSVFYDSKGSPNVQKVLQGSVIQPVLLSGIMHQKTLVLDHNLVFLGSANFTPTSLKMHDNLVIGFYSPKIASFLEEKLPYQNGYIRTFVSGQDVEIWLLPDPKGHALTDLKRKIKTACRSLKIALFTLTHPSLIQEIILAKKRGIDVKVVIDMHSALGASASAVEQLVEAKVDVLISQGVQLMHHKFAIIDDKTLIAGSTNWTKSAFEKNSDLLMILHNLSETQKQTMLDIWDNLYSIAQKPKPKTSQLLQQKYLKAKT